MLANVTHILPLTTIRRDRMLPVPGKLLVRKGQRVAATDTIGETFLHAPHILLDLARGLGLSAEKTDEHLQVEVGTQVVEGDIIAGPVGFGRRVVRSPGSGRVLLVGSGQALIELEGKPFELKAGLPGEVIELVGDQGATIETTGALIQGVWGNGLIDFGLMYVLIKSPDDEFANDQLDMSLRGSVVLAGYCRHAETLTAAAELPLRAILLSSIDPELIPVARKLKIPVLVLEGFGRRPMNPITFKLLTTNEQREVAVNAEEWDRFRDTRPELIIPLPAPGDPPLPPKTEVFAEGQQVRVLRAPYAGQIGQIVSLPAGKLPLPSGIQTYVAEVRLDDGQQGVVPLVNLEVLK